MITMYSKAYIFEEMSRRVIVSGVPVGDIRCEPLSSNLDVQSNYICDLGSRAAAQERPCSLEDVNIQTLCSILRVSFKLLFHESEVLLV